MLDVENARGHPIRSTSGRTTAWYASCVRALFGLALLAGFVSIGKPASAGSDDVQAQVTVYSATWCGPCKVLKAGLHERNIPFEEVDVDQNPGAFAFAKKASGANAIPLTNVVRGLSQRWIVGSDVDGVVKAYKGE
jgi:mycoredoxin